MFLIRTWGYTSTLPSDYNDLVAKAKIGTAAIKRVNGRNFINFSLVKIDQRIFV